MFVSWLSDALLSGLCEGEFGGEGEEEGKGEWDVVDGRLLFPPLSSSSSPFMASFPLLLPFSSVRSGLNPSRPSVGHEDGSGPRWETIPYGKLDCKNCLAWRILLRLTRSISVVWSIGVNGSLIPVVVVVVAAAVVVTGRGYSEIDSKDEGRRFHAVDDEDEKFPSAVTGFAATFLAGSLVDDSKELQTLGPLSTIKLLPDT